MRHDTIRDDVRVNLWMLFMPPVLKLKKERREEKRQKEGEGRERERNKEKYEDAEHEKS